MQLEAGARLGPYEIVALLGAGGMGVVYRAQDPRLGRPVAIKVLPRAWSLDADRLHRFEQEARSASQLNHPNILVVHDLGTHEGCPYIVCELLEGETLRQRLQGGSLPMRKALEIALDLAHGLGAAHEKGIVHRDLKPENVFLTDDGRVKILDFGLAKLTQPAARAAGESDDVSTIVDLTQPGSVLGTVGYMSPEQVRGESADQRSDIFSLGSILYEMLSGRRAFHAGNAAETMSAILREEPPDLTSLGRGVPEALDRVVRRCLDKKPAQRFQSARDLAFHLETLDASSQTTPLLTARSLFRTRRTVSLRPALLALAILVALAGGVWLGRRTVPVREPLLQRLTFRNGFVTAARFAPDGQTILYGAAWDGSPSRIFSTRIGSPEARALDLRDADLLSVSPSGELAILLGRTLGRRTARTLARVSLEGGAPREVKEGVAYADWSPDGGSLAVIRREGTLNRIEYPIGKMVYEAPESHLLGHLRVSRRGELAFVEYAPGLSTTTGNLPGAVMLMEPAGTVRKLSRDWRVLGGVEWAPGDELWFTASDGKEPPVLRAVDHEGRERILLKGFGGLQIKDVSRDGRVLLGNVRWREGVLGVLAGEARERDLSWLDWSTPVDLSEDGKLLLFDESREGGGPESSVFLRGTDNSLPIRLTDGRGLGLSRDGRWALATKDATPHELILLPTGPGDFRIIRSDRLTYCEAAFFPDTKRLLVVATEPGHRFRAYVQDLAGGAPRPFTPDGIDSRALSPDGSLLAAASPDGTGMLYAVAGGEPSPIRGFAPGDMPLRFGRDRNELWVLARAELPARLYRLDLSTGRRELRAEIRPPDPAGVFDIDRVLVTPDGASYVYCYGRNLSDLYLVDGLR